VWQDVTLSLGKDKVVIAVGDQSVEAENATGHGFVSDQIVFNEELAAEIRDVKVYSAAHVD
jgi:hypothetical protein